MTFKHMKFEDSPTMRALEKVAKEKGLVKPETLEKKASVAKKADYTPTPNLMENIFKLCAGLRAQGLVKEAAEIETNYLQYKQAQTLYETSKEKGEDLVDAAHPKGSHKLEGVEGDEATIETIVDQHLKHLQMIEKKPTGKLSTASILKSVKKALGQTTIKEVTVEGKVPPQTEEEWTAELDKQSNTIQRFVTSAAAKMKEYGNLEEYYKSSLDEVVKEMRLALSSRPFTVDSYRQVQEALAKLQGFAEQGDFASHWYQSEESDKKGQSLWNTYVAPHIMPIINGIGKLLPIAKKLDEIRVAKEQGTYKPPAPRVNPSDEMLKKINGLSAQYIALSNQISSDDPKDAQALLQTKAWLKQKAQALQTFATQYQGEADKESVLAVYQATLNKYAAALQKIQQEWS